MNTLTILHSTRRLVRMRIAAGLFALLIAIGAVGIGTSPSTAGAAVGEFPWSTVGSVGTVDEAGLPIVEFTGYYAHLKSSAPLPATLHIRYNVIPLNGALGGDGLKLKVRYVDTGSAARVVVNLKGINLDTGIVTDKLVFFDSNSFAPSIVAQTRNVAACGISLDSRNAYWLETQMTKSAPTADPLSPAIAGMQLTSIIC